MTDISDVIGITLNKPASDRMIHFRGTWYERGWVRDYFDKLGAAIDALNLPPDAPIGFAAESAPEFIAGLLTLLERQQPIVMIYAYMSGEALASKLRDLALPAIIASTKKWPGALASTAEEMGTAAIAISREGAGVETLLPYDPGRGFDLRSSMAEPGIELLTSGTTGPPKQFPISYKKLFARMVLSNTMSVNARRPALLYFPLGNISGIYTFLPVVASDDQIILLDKFRVPEWVEFIKQVQPVRTNLPPAAFRMILDAQVPAEDIACIDYISTGAATLDPTLRKEFEATYDIAILQAFGATEFGGVVAATQPEDIQVFGRAKSDSVGRAWGGANLRIVDPETGEFLAANTEGRLEVHAPAMSNEWISTTDLCVIDDDGFLYHRGRLDGAIMRGGFKIIPEQVAETLATHADVASAAVVGLTDKRLGQVPVAAIELRDRNTPPTTDELEAHLRAKLPATMLPTQYKFVDSLPRTPSLKVDMSAVRGLFV